LNKRIPFVLSPIIIILQLIITPCSISATGLYSDFPAFFAVVDTARAQLTFRQTEIQADAGLVSIFEGEYGMRLGNRTKIRGSILYPTLAYSEDITSAVGDGFIRGTLRITGDTLNIDGIYMRFDAQIPIGSASMTPYSFRSLDVGLGFEARKDFPMFEIKGAATYTLVGEKQKIGDFTYDNYLIAGALIGFEPMSGTSFLFSGYVKAFRSGGSREVYLLTLRQRLSGNLDLILDGALDSGKDEERVFNSLISIAFYYRFPPLRASGNGK
jgi:hypothetical protein